MGSNEKMSCYYSILKISINQDLGDIYAEARALGEADACANFVSNTTDALCATILAEDLISDLSDLVGFPTIACHSDDDVSHMRPLLLSTYLFLFS